VALVGGEFVLFAVYGAAGRGKDHLFQRPPSRRLQKVEQTQEVDVGVEERVGNRTPDIHLCRVVNEDLDLSVDQELARLLGAHVEHMEIGVPWHVLLATTRKVVHNQYPVAVRHQSVRDVAADKTGTAGDADG